LVGRDLFDGLLLFQLRLGAPARSLGDSLEVCEDRGRVGGHR
jgi:hypothetical protein